MKPIHPPDNDRSLPSAGAVQVTALQDMIVDRAEPQPEHQRSDPHSPRDNEDPSAAGAALARSLCLVAIH